MQMQNSALLICGRWSPYAPFSKTASTLWGARLKTARDTEAGSCHLVFDDLRRSSNEEISERKVVVMEERSQKKFRVKRRTMFDIV